MVTFGAIPASNPPVWKMRIDGTWRNGANLSTNTNQLTDGAGLGTKATWENVTGTGKPASGATKNTWYNQPSAPSSPIDGDAWYDSSAQMLKLRVSGAWASVGDITAGKTAAAISGQGALATLGQINSSSLIASNVIVGNHVAANVITASHLMADSVTSAKIQAGAVTADKIFVSSLSAINANIGNITAGTIAAGVIGSGVINSAIINSTGYIVSRTATYNPAYLNAAILGEPSAQNIHGAAGSVASTTAAGVVGRNTAGGIAMFCMQQFAWGAYTYNAPNGSATSFLCANGTWATPSGGGSSGVSSFNSRTGAVTLSATDVTTALGATAVQNAQDTGKLGGHLASQYARPTGVTSASVGTIGGRTAYWSDFVHNGVTYKMLIS
jgi:hypothetical protein